MSEPSEVKLPSREERIARLFKPYKPKTREQRMKEDRRPTEAMMAAVEAEQAALAKRMEEEERRVAEHKRAEYQKAIDRTWVAQRAQAEANHYYRQATCNRHPDDSDYGMSGTGFRDAFGRLEY